MGRLVSREAFLDALMALYQESRDKGTVSVQVKRGGRKATKTRAATGPFLVVRAYSGKKKLSTMIPADDKSDFHDQLTTIMLGAMDNLKKKDRKRKSAAASGAGKKK